MKTVKIIPLAGAMLYFAMYACTGTPAPPSQEYDIEDAEQRVEIPEQKRDYTAADFTLTKEFLYDQYTPEDIYPYKDTTRRFQWEKIKEGLARLENFQRERGQWGILQNRRNANGAAPVVKNHKSNAYGNISDAYGVERYQSVPVYDRGDSIVPERYANDGSLIRIVSDTSEMAIVEVAFFDGLWMVPAKYAEPLEEDVFTKVIFVDRENQNICTMERGEDPENWKIRSMNPATTGAHNPPYGHETPLGIFVFQEKKEKMMYYKDGTTDLAGYAPYASRFCNGAYIHGVPVNSVNGSMIEYSQTLGTIPRSHMCVRNATSHAKFVYDWGPVGQTIVFVIE